jgi:hypothetical protein
VDLTRDPANCGACGNVCTPPVGAIASTCVDSQCVFECAQSRSTTCGGACVATGVDPNNCGACGHVCASGQACIQPGVCVAPRALILAGATTPGALATDADNVYWLDSGTYTVNAVAKSGGSVRTLASYQYDLTNGMHIALDDAYVYWIANGILRTRKDGTGAIESVAPATPAPDSLAVIGGTVIFDTGGPNLWSVPVTGGTPVTYGCPGGPVIADGTSVYHLQPQTIDFLLFTCTPPSATEQQVATYINDYGEDSLSPTAPGYVVEWQLPGVTTTRVITIVPPPPGTPTCTPPNMTESMLWQPAACGYAVDYGTAGGLQFAAPGQPNTQVLSDAALASLGDFTQILFDRDGYEYFIDGNHDIGRISVR